MQAPVADKPPAGLVHEVADAAKEKVKEKAADAAWSWLVSTLWPFVFGATAGALTGAGAGAIMAHVVSEPKDDGAMVTMVAQAADGGVPPLSGMGVVTVLSVPSAGRVTLDGRLVGTTPIARLDVLPGTHAVVVEEDGYAPFTGSVAVAPGAHVPVLATLLVQQAAPDAGAAPSRRGRGGSWGGGSYRPPARDCYGEEQDCKSRCGHTETSCEMSCFGCSGCNTSMTSEECADRCRQCREGCVQNGRFCESSCEGQREACQSG